MTKLTAETATATATTTTTTEKEGRDKRFRLSAMLRAKGMHSDLLRVINNITESQPLFLHVQKAASVYSALNRFGSERFAQKNTIEDDHIIPIEDEARDSDELSEDEKKVVLEIAGGLRLWMFDRGQMQFNPTDESGPKLVTVVKKITQIVKEMRQIDENNPPPEIELINRNNIAERIRTLIVDYVEKMQDHNEREAIRTQLVSLYEWQLLKIDELED